MTATKGWDVIEKMKIPKGWTIVVNSSKNHYSTEYFNPDFLKKSIVNLEKDFLTEKNFLFSFPRLMPLSFLTRYALVQA